MLTVNMSTVDKSTVYFYTPPDDEFDEDGVDGEDGVGDEDDGEDVEDADKDDDAEQFVQCELFRALSSSTTGTRN